MKSTAEARARLIEILQERSVRRERVILASGKESDFYVDARQTTLHAEGAALVAELILARLRPDVVAVGGPVTGADPIAGAVAAISWTQARPVQGFMVRKEPKGHGLRRGHHHDRRQPAQGDRAHRRGGPARGAVHHGGGPPGGRQRAPRGARLHPRGPGRARRPDLSQAVQGMAEECCDVEPRCVCTSARRAHGQGRRADPAARKRGPKAQPADQPSALPSGQLVSVLHGLRHTAGACPRCSRSLPWRRA